MKTSYGGMATANFLWLAFLVWLPGIVQGIRGRADIRGELVQPFPGYGEGEAMGYTTGYSGSTLRVAGSWSFYE